MYLSPLQISIVNYFIIKKLKIEMSKAFVRSEKSKTGSYVCTYMHIIHVHV